MKKVIVFVSVAAALALIPGLALAQGGFPTRTVKFIVPFPAGGLNDIPARIVGDKLQTKWGHPVVIENKTGAGGNIGAELAFHAAPDGYTLLLCPPGPLAINQTLYKRLAYKPAEFEPITVVSSASNVVTIRNELPVNSLKELVEYIKARPNKVLFGSQGNGATPHLTAMMFQTMTGTQMIHVPYRGENLVLNDMIGGHVDLFFGNVGAVKPLYRAGKVKVLAVADKNRSPDLPEVPTTAEAGLPGLISTTWFALAGPPKLPATLQTEIANAVIEVLKMPDVQASLRAISMTPGAQSPAATTAFIKSEAQRWGEIIRKNNIVVD